MKIAILDDNEGFLSTGLMGLEQSGHEIQKFAEPETFIQWVLEADEALVLFVDHDLGRELVGYDVVRTIRRARSDGLILPIVYLTGRETEQGFLNAEAEDPYSAPSLFINKRSLIKVNLEAVVARLNTQYEDARELAESQAVKEAMKFFEQLPDHSILER